MMPISRSTRPTSLASLINTEHPEVHYTKVLLMRGILDTKKPELFHVPKFIVHGDRRRFHWTWTSNGLKGLSLVTFNNLELGMLREWEQLATLCRLDPILFMSTYRKKPDLHL